MTPFLQPSSDPNKMQCSTSKGITVFRLWKRVLQVKKMRINAGNGASENHEKRGRFITPGCAKTAEILFVSATNHMLAMFAHFKDLGPKCSSPHKSGTKTTERIISELQGKTNQIQSLDAQPTLADMLIRVSNVQFNQLAEDRLIQAGAKKQSSTNRRRLSHSIKNVEVGNYIYPKKYAEFLEQQRNAHRQGVKEGQKLFESYCVGGANLLKERKQWDFLNVNEIVPLKYQFTGNLPDGYALDKLKNISTSTLLANACSYAEEELDELVDAVDDSEDLLSTHSLKFESTNELELDEDNPLTLSNSKKWYVSKKIGAKMVDMHIKRALKILIPREYVS